MLLAVPVLVLAACGGDDDSSKTSPSGAASGQQDGVKAQTGVTGATGITGATGTTGTRRKRTAKPNRGSSANETGAPSEAGPTSPSQSTPKEKQAKPKAEGIQYPKSVGRELSKQARAVCKALTLEVLVQQYMPKSRSPKDVGEAYAARYPESLRKSVAAGCEAGLLESG